MPGTLTHAAQVEVFFFDGAEIDRGWATDLAIATDPHATLIQIVALRDLGTRTNPTVTPYGNLWREFVESGAYARREHLL